MALSISTMLTNMRTQCDAFYVDMYNASLQISALGDAIVANNWLAAHTSCDNAATYMQLALLHSGASTGTTIYRYIGDMFDKINTDWPTGGSVTMSAILNAMLLAEYDELQKFVGIEDAFRSAIWDQPFNAQFYAALANGFRP